MGTFSKQLLPKYGFALRSTRSAIGLGQILELLYLIFLAVYSSSRDLAVL